MRRKRKNHGSRIAGAVVLATMAGASALALGACGSSSSGSSSSGGGGSKTMTIGLSDILSGPYAAYGQVGDGIQAYVDAVNASGGIHGYKFNLAVKDNAYQSTQAVVITKAFAENNDLAIFELGDPATDASLPIVKALQVPIMAAANGDEFTPPPSPVAYTANPPFSGLGMFEASFIVNHLHTKHWALSYDDDDTGTPVERTVPAWLKAQGGSLQAQVSVDPAATSFSAYAAQLKNSGATVVQAFNGISTFTGLQKAAAAIGYHPTWVTYFTQDNPVYPSLVGSSLSNGVYADNFLDASPSVLKPFNAAMKKYEPKSAYGSQLAQIGWSQAAILFDGIEKATANGGTLSRTSLTTALGTLHGVPAGFFPTVAFSSSTHAAANEDAMYEYTGSTAKEVTPYEKLPALPAGVNPNG